MAQIPSGPADPHHGAIPAPEAVDIAGVYATVVSVWDNEADRFWMRNNILLVLNGALFGFATTSNIAWQLRIFGCLLGIYVSLCWILLNAKGSYYVYRWRPAIEAIEVEIGKRPGFEKVGLPFTAVPIDEHALEAADTFRAKRDVLLGRRPPKVDAAGMMRLIILGFIIAWASLTIFTLFTR
jgi:hypothetical protein